MLPLNFFSKYYVGFKKTGTVDNQLLGFATHVEGVPSRDNKRMETVDGWRDKNIPTVTIDNEPTYGFEILDVVSRSSTDNKLFRVKDPRGFELEISSGNLFNIIGSCTISKGIIADKMVWARYGQLNWLIDVASEEYKDYQAQKNVDKITTHEIGKVYINKLGNIRYIYQGRYYGVSVAGMPHSWNIGRSNSSYYNREANPTFTFNRDSIPLTVRIGKKPYFLYKEEREDYRWDGGVREILPSKFELLSRSSFVPDLRSCGDTVESLVNYKPLNDIVFDSYYSTSYYKNKQDAVQADFSKQSIIKYISKTLIEELTKYYPNNVTEGQIFENLTDRVSIYDLRVE